MINFFKFCFWYQISHRHYLSAQRCLRKQSLAHSEKKFKRLVWKGMYHMKKFAETQQILDDLKEEICKKHPELRDEA